MAAALCPAAGGERGGGADGRQPVSRGAQAAAECEGDGDGDGGRSLAGLGEGGAKGSSRRTGTEKAQGHVW